MADRTNTRPLAVLIVGVSMLITGAAAWWIRSTPEPTPVPESRDGLFPFRDPATGQAGYIDADGKIVVPARFDHTDLFRGGRGMAELDGRTGFLDRNGDWAVSPRFELDPSFANDVAARPFWGGRAAARMGGAWGFVDAQGSWLIRPRFKGLDGFQIVGDFHEGLAWFRGRAGVGDGKHRPTGSSTPRAAW